MNKMYELISGIEVDEETFKELVRQLTDFKTAMRVNLSKSNVMVPEFLLNMNLSDIKWKQSVDVNLEKIKLFADSDSYKDEVDKYAVTYLVGYIEVNLFNKIKIEEVCRIKLTVNTKIGVVYD